MSLMSSLKSECQWLCGCYGFNAPAYECTKTIVVIAALVQHLLSLSIVKILDTLTNINVLKKQLIFVPSPALYLCLLFRLICVNQNEINSDTEVLFQKGRGLQLPVGKSDIRLSGREFRILCLKGTVVSFISPSRPSLAYMCTKMA